MLGKLIKYEWKVVWKILTTIDIFVLCLTIVGSFGILFFMRLPSDPGPVPVMLAVLYLITYILCLVGALPGSMIYLGIRFYRSMYGDEGYLTHTLPATPLQLISAKAITAVLWSWISGLVMVVSILILYLSYAVPRRYPIGTEIINAFKNLISKTRAYGYSPLGIGLMNGIYIIAGSVAAILMIYCATALGQLFNKHRLLGAVGIYFGLNVLLQAFTSMATVLSITALTTHTEGETPFKNGRLFFQISGWLNLLITVLIAAVCFFLTHFLTRRKLNLE